MNDLIQVVSILAAALAVSFGAIGPALGEGHAVAAAMIETMAIYCLVIALLVLFANPFIK
jgi:F-type H+-transporting ATPase subunit c